MQIDTSKLGFFSFNELAAYMGILPPEIYDDEDDEDFDSDEEGGADEEAEEEDVEGGEEGLREGAEP